jgi:DNA-binding NarL/FixJ family response regulator
MISTEAQQTVLVVEDIEPVRRGLVALVREIFRAPVVFEAGSFRTARAIIATEACIHLGLIDLGLPDGNGTELLRQLRERHPRVCLIVSTIYDDDAHVFSALKAGADGYLLKDRPREELLRTLQRAIEGVPALSPAIARRMLLQFRDGEDAPEVSLTNREREVLSAIARGLRILDVATELAISEHTARGHVKELYRKLHIGTRAEAALEARKRGLA